MCLSQMLDPELTENACSILTVGPSFQINAQAKAVLDVNVDMTVGINYKIKNAELVFPPSSKHAAGGSFNIGDTRALIF